MQSIIMLFSFSVVFSAYSITGKQENRKSLFPCFPFSVCQKTRLLFSGKQIISGKQKVIGSAFYEC